MLKAVLLTTALLAVSYAQTLGGGAAGLAGNSLPGGFGGGMGAGVGNAWGVDFNQPLEQICNMAFLKTGGTDAMSDIMGAAVRSLETTASRTGMIPQQMIGSNPRWQCLYARSSGGLGGSAAGAIADYMDTATEFRYLIGNPCTNPMCSESGLTPVQLLLQAVSSARFGGMGGRGMNPTMGANPMSAILAGGATGQLPGGGQQALSLPANLGAATNVVSSKPNVVPGAPGSTLPGGAASVPQVAGSPAALPGLTFNPALAGLFQQPTQGQLPTISGMGSTSAGNEPMSNMARVMQAMSFNHLLQDGPDGMFGFPGMGMGMGGMGRPGMGGMAGMPGLGGMAGMPGLGGMAGMPGLGSMAGLGQYGGGFPGSITGFNPLASAGLPRTG